MSFDFDDPRLGDVGDGARMLHYVLTAASSARGRFPAGARALTRHLRLTDAVAVEAHLSELVQVGAVRLYEGIVDGVRVVVGELVIGRPKRSPSKAAELGADPLPAPAEERESRSELSATPPAVAPQGAPKVVPSVGPAVVERQEREEREIQSSLSPARAKPRRRKPPREQLALGSPVEAQVEVPEPIRAAVEAWESRAATLRAAGVCVPPVARADLVALAEGVDPAVFVDAVGHHVRSKPRYWGSPLVLLAKRIEWQSAARVQVPAPPTIPLEARLTALAASPASGVADLARAALDPTPPPSPTPRGHSLSPPRVVDALLTVPDDEWAEDWAQALARLRDVVEPWDVVHRLEPLDGRGVTVDGEPALLAPDASHARWVEEHFGGQIEAALGYRPRIATPAFSGEGLSPRTPAGRPELAQGTPVWAAADMPAPPRRKPGREGAAAPAHLVRGGGDAHA